MILYAAIQSQSIQSIVLSTQSFDNILVHIFNKTCAVGFQSKTTPEWICVSSLTQESMSSSPFGNTVIIFSFGLLMVMVLSISLGIFNLEDNIGLQMRMY